MDVAWSFPEEGFLKVNVHCESRDIPLPNGNMNEVVVIILNREGEMVWAAMGPIHGQKNLQATLWGVHAGMMKTNLLKHDKIIIESDSIGAHEIIHLQDEIYVGQPLQEALSQFKTLHNNHFNEVSIRL